MDNINLTDVLDFLNMFDELNDLNSFLKESKEFVLPEIEGQNYTVDIYPSSIIFGQIKKRNKLKTDKKI